MHQLDNLSFKYNNGVLACRDVGQYCGDWARKGECNRNPSYMRLNCKKSCRLCKLFIVIKLHIHIHKNYVVRHHFSYQKVCRF